MASDYTDPAAYDMGISTLGRINFELWHCNTARREQDLELALHTWWTSLLNIYIELTPFMNESEKKEQNIHLKSCEKTVLHFNPQLRTRRVYDNFIQWEIVLRAMMDQKGLLMKKGEQAAGAMI